MKDGHCIWADTPFECDSGRTQQERLCWARVRNRLVSCHLRAYELRPVVNERKKCAIALHLVYTMLNEGVKCNVGARNGNGWRPIWGIEGKGCRGKIAKKSLSQCGCEWTIQTAYAAISWARARSWASRPCAGSAQVESPSIIRLVWCCSQRGGFVHLLATVQRCDVGTSGNGGEGCRRSNRVTFPAHQIDKPFETTHAAALTPLHKSSHLHRLRALFDRANHTCFPKSICI